MEAIIENASPCCPLKERRKRREPDEWQMSGWVGNPTVYKRFYFGHYLTVSQFVMVGSPVWWMAEIDGALVGIYHDSLEKCEQRCETLAKRDPEAEVPSPHYGGHYPPINHVR